MDTLPQTARPEELAKVYHEVAGRAARILGDFAKKCPQPGAVSDELGIAKAYMDLYSRMLADPMALATHAMNMWLDYAQLWQSSWMKMLGQDVKPVAVPDPGDARFKDDAMGEQFPVRLHQAVLSDRLAAYPACGLRRRRAVRRIAKEGSVLHPDVRGGASAVELRDDQSAGPARNLVDGRREPAQRTQQPARRHREGRWSAAHQHDR